MGALANATVLRKDAEFRSWVETAIAYQARLALTESAATADHAIRERLARDAAVTPGIVLELMVTGVATDPAVANKGATAQLVTEAVVIDAVGALWTPIAKLTYPNG